MLNPKQLPNQLPNPRITQRIQRLLDLPDDLALQAGLIQRIEVHSSGREQRSGEISDDPTIDDLLTVVSDIDVFAMTQDLPTRRDDAQPALSPPIPTRARVVGRRVDASHDPRLLRIRRLIRHLVQQLGAAGRAVR